MTAAITRHRRTLRLQVSDIAVAASVALALAGFGIATYLSFVHYAGQPIACSAVGDCNYVNSSEYAKVAGVPVAVLGAAAYAAIAMLIAAWRLTHAGPLLVVAWMVTAASFAFSMYLTYIELEVLEAICIYCVASAATITALLVAVTALAWTQREEL